MATGQELDYYWDFLVINEIATTEELQLVTNINGYSKESLNSVLYARTAYRDLEQYKKCEPYC